MNLRDRLSQIVGLGGPKQTLSVKEIQLAAKPQNKPTKETIQLIEQANVRVRQDINSWRHAQMIAENPDMPKRLLLYNLYDDLVLDPHLSGVWENVRKERLLGEDFRITDAQGKEDVELTTIFQKDWFYQLLSLALDSKLYGHSLIQFNYIDSARGCSIDMVPRRHVVPEKGIILINQYDEAGFDYRTSDLAKWVFEVGGRRDLGLLNKAAADILIKKNVKQAWSQFCELFGMPLRKGVTSNNDADRQRMAAWLRDMGKAQYVVLQSGETVELIESKHTDAYQVYKECLNTNNAEISKLIIGNTMTTDNGSSKSQGEVHERVTEGVSASDRRFITSLCNEKLFPFLMLHGFKLQGKELRFNKPKDIQGMWNRTYQALQYFDIPEEYIEENFGIPVTPKQAGKAPANLNAEQLDIVRLHLKLNELYNHDH